ncbi:hypothetical protein NCH01_07780 [Neoasaia chiangmaiensis]|uniref:Pectin acetylesterase n=2 Tax=Neoasaia chiangmaiensis TaxID=320497 RepID=A0A1U9KPW9_9PROT|nr:pectin acetylesterase [Neoasaia chiangmaiensis]GEN14347.1 hypothetical protein NCH01_07780 [Neoasaia chiangmaiensis]
MGGLLGRQALAAEPLFSWPDFPETVSLWSGSSPAGPGPEGRPIVSARGSATDIARPVLGVFRPARPNGAAVLIAAGGGYRHLNLGSEAMPAARWLNTLGVTAFVLVYRLPREGWTNTAMAPFQDVQRAVRLVRARASTYGIDPGRIGGLGFSAGGHLIGLHAVRQDWPAGQPVDPIDRVPDRLNAVMLLYPVVTLESPFGHTQTRRQLLGEWPDAAACAAWSIQTYIRAGDAPFFLAQAEDDPIANPENTAILTDACRARGVPVERHLYPDGGHGFGMGRPGTPTMAWPGQAYRWMRLRRLI